MNTLFNTPEERHAFVIGFCEVFCPWPPRFRSQPTQVFCSEYHYYTFGRALGVIAWLIIAKVIQEAFW